MRRPRLPAALAFALLAVLSPSRSAISQAPARPAAAPPAGEPFTESIDVRVVNVEVFVTDRDGHPVTGLGKDDFELAEDGRPVAITNFYAQAYAQTAPAAPAAPGSPAAPAAAAPAEAPAAVPEAQRLDLGIFVDNLNLTPVARNRVLGAVKDFVASHVTAGDRVLLASFDGSVRIRQAPTRDPKALVAAVDEISRSTPRGAHASRDLRNILQTISGTFGGSANNNAMVASLPHEVELFVKERYDEDRASLAALDDFIGSLAGLPGRKALLFVSGGMSLRPGEVALQAFADKFGQQMANDIPRPNEAEIQPLLTKIVARANASRVTLYGIGAPEDFNSFALEIGAAASNNLQFVTRDNLAGVMRTVSDFTGGFAGIDLNDPKVLLDRLRGDLETFYSLGFSPVHAADGKDHKVAVRVKNAKGLTVRTREHYRDRDEGQRLTDRASATLAFGVQDNPLGMKLVLERDEPGKDKNRVVSILVVFPTEKLVLVPGEAASTGRVTLFVGSRDEHGRLSPINRIDVPLTIPAARVAAHQPAAYRVRLALRPEAQTVAVAARDELGKTESTIAALYQPAAAPKAPGQ